VNSKLTVILLESSDVPGARAVLERNLGLNFPALKMIWLKPFMRHWRLIVEGDPETLQLVRKAAYSVPVVAEAWTGERRKRYLKIMVEEGDR
jgi:hypothetical protein